MENNNFENKLCNYRNPIKCPLENKSLTKSIVNQCIISSTENPDVKKFYIGSTKNLLN